VNLAFDFFDAAQTTGAFFLRQEAGLGLPLRVLVSCVISRVCLTFASL
jgi:hypothetical protein